MSEAVAPVFDEIGFQQFVFLRGDGVAELSVVADGYPLIPSFFSHHLLPLEGVEPADGDIQVGQRH